MNNNNTSLLATLREQCKQLSDNIQTLQEKKAEIEKQKAAIAAEREVLLNIAAKLSLRQKELEKTATRTDSARNKRNGHTEKKKKFDKKEVKGTWKWN
jgi:hypothetical protein